MEKIMKNEELMKKIASVETAEELEKIFAENGIALEAGVTAQQFLDAMNGPEATELGEDDLDSVSGGVIITPAIIAAAAFAGISLAKYLKKHFK